MVDPATSRLWVFRALFLALCAVVIFLQLLPMQIPPSRWAAPDLLIGFTFAWVLRRPDYVPVLSVALVFLAADLLFQRPPGLATALVVGGSEFLRSRSHFMREFPFALEWAIVATIIAVVMLGNRLVLMAVFVEPPDFGLTAIHFVATVLAYPLVVMLSRYVLGVQHLQPGGTDSARSRT